MVSHPNEANKMVFIRILEDVGPFKFDDGTDEGDAVDLKKGRILFCKFQQFKGLLDSSEEGGTRTPCSRCCLNEGRPRT